MASAAPEVDLMDVVVAGVVTEVDLIGHGGSRCSTRGESHRP